MENEMIAEANPLLISTHFYPSLLPLVYFLSSMNLKINY